MTEKEIQNKLIKLFERYFFEKVIAIKRIKGGVSDRIVYKINSKNYVCTGVHNSKLKENIAFIEFSKSLKDAGFNVPEIYSVKNDYDFYIEEYVGDKSLFDLTKNNEISADKKLSLYKKAISDLALIQTGGNKVIDYRLCYETEEFNSKQIIFDFTKFHNFYLRKLAGIRLSIIGTSLIINLISKKLLKEKKLFFMYRDFQPRNIMLNDESLYYIDYQSGRKGPLQYDIASFLYSGSIDIEEKGRKELLNYYIKEISKHVKVNADKFKSSFYYFAFIRLIQVLGSYGYVYEKNRDKNIFNKINKALKNIDSIKDNLEEKVLKDFADEITSKTF
ncbi:MAG: phosphotransferase [Ignavibacteria bacterium]|jgi:aminoglycoside/choline kinase family phosphotransferase